MLVVVKWENKSIGLYFLSWKGVGGLPSFTMVFCRTSLLMCLSKQSFTIRLLSPFFNSFRKGFFIDYDVCFFLCGKIEMFPVFLQIVHLLQLLKEARKIATLTQWEWGSFTSAHYGEEWEKKKSKTDTWNITVEEMIGIFLVALGHGFENRMTQERFQHS